MNQSKINQHIQDINKLTHVQMATLWRFAPIGHPYFDQTQELYSVFKKRFECFGGMTVEVSKTIGWDRDVRHG